ncbi:MAG TPA: TetR/AcrR family transcriptional regulator [Flavisolibacter sp.]|nr:TetR/AcrR family transcriptional regulator [Flavisolibacter sp.]
MPAQPVSKAARTRKALLQKAFELIYAKGYQATSIDEILATTEVTKGAFFYHFRNKEKMGLAMISEIMQPDMRSVMILPLQQSEEPIKSIYLMMETILMKHPLFRVQYGCPAVNLIEEMAPVNEAFRCLLAELVLEWQKAIAACIQKGKKRRQIRHDVSPKGVACFITSGYSGIRNLGKLAGRSSYKTYLAELKRYLEGLG